MGILLKLLLVVLAARLLVAVYRTMTRGSTRSSGRQRPPVKRVRGADIVDAEFEDKPGQQPGDAKR